MKVALACPYAWDRPGGVQVHIRQLSAALRERGHETLVLTPSDAPSHDPDVRIVGRPRAIRYQGTVAPIAPSPLAAGRIRAALRAFDADVTHVHEPLTPSTAMFAALVSSVPCVATFHAFAERSRLLSLAAPLLRPVWRRLAVRLAVSEAAASFVRRRFAGAVRVVPNGCDVDLFARASTERADPPVDLPAGRRVLWVGRLDPQKGFSVAVRAFGILARDLPDVWFVVAGEGRDRTAVDTLEAGARRRVLLLGTVDHGDLPAYHAVSDAFMSPALGQESFGITLVEAMAAGVPVVASDVPGYREVVRSGRDGLLVPPGDARALADALRTVLDDAGFASALRAGGRIRAERFRWDVVTGEIEAAYEDALREPTAPLTGRR